PPRRLSETHYGARPGASIWPTSVATSPLAAAPTSAWSRARSPRSCASAGRRSCAWPARCTRGNAERRRGRRAVGGGGGRGEITRQQRSYGLAIAWAIVVCVSIQAQAAALVWNGPASECSARPRDTPTKKYGTSSAPAQYSYRTNLMNSFIIASPSITPSAGQDRSSRSALVGYARRGADNRR